MLGSEPESYIRHHKEGLDLESMFGGHNEIADTCKWHFWNEIFF